MNSSVGGAGNSRITPGQRSAQAPAPPVAVIGGAAWPFAPWLDGFLGTALLGIGLVIAHFAAPAIAETIGCGTMAVGGLWIGIAWWRLSTAGKLWLFALAAFVAGAWLRGLPTTGETGAATMAALVAWVMAGEFAPAGGFGIAALTATLYRPLGAESPAADEAEKARGANPRTVSRLDGYR